MARYLRSPGITALQVVLALAALVYAGALGFLYFDQERLIFRGLALSGDHRFHFEEPFQEIRVPVDGASLDALYFPQSDPRGLVFFLHGNAGNLETWTTGVDFYRRVNYDLFIFDYRGYGKSTGRIESERQLHDDVRAAWDAIAPRYAGKPIVIYGRSLGTALAAHLARDVHPALLVLVSPYTSLTAVGRRLYPWAPEWLVRYPLRTDADIDAITNPILLLHGRDDTLIPAEESIKLRALARGRADLVLIDGAGHADIHRFPGYIDTLAARLTALGAR